MRKILHQPYINRGLIPNIHRELKKLNTNKPNNPIKTWVTELNRKFSTEESLMTEKHLMKHSKHLVMRELQIKMTLRFHLMPVRMAKI